MSRQRRGGGKRSRDYEGNPYRTSTTVGVVGVLFAAIGWPPIIAGIVLCITTALCVSIARLEEQL